MFTTALCCRRLCLPNKNIVAPAEIKNYQCRQQCVVFCVGENVKLSKFNWIRKRFYLCKTSLIKTTARQGTNKSEKVIPELITQF
jgi:hypothetical protein